MMDELLPFLLIGALLLVLAVLIARLIRITAARRGFRLVRPIYKLVVLEGEHKGKAFHINRTPFYIGRSDSCAVHLKNEPTVSRHHAYIAVEESSDTKLMLVDNRSMNGVYSDDGRRIFQKLLAPGDRFRIGRTVFALANSNGVVPPAPASPHSSVPNQNSLSRLGRYEIGPKVGRGGFMTVYRATDLRNNQTVALKVLTVQTDVRVQQYMRRKIRDWLHLGLALSHPHCVRLLDGNADSDPAYLVEEFIPGKKLSDMMSQLTDLDSRVRVIGEICHGLYFLHKNGIIHRDLSPNNVMFDEKKRCKLIDFGLARYDHRPTITQYGMLIGTPTYFSPEHARCDPTQLCPQSDLYSLGVIAFHLFTGRPPFVYEQGNYEDLVKAHIRLPPPRPRELVPDIPDDIETAILRALNKRPQERFKDALEMARAFGYKESFHLGSLASQSVQRAFAGSQFNEPLKLQRSDGTVLTIAPPQMHITRELIAPDDSAISRREHGRFVYQQDGFWRIEPPAQKSLLIYIDDTLLDEPTLLGKGDRIRIGKTTLTVL